jgi:protein TonB
VYRSDLNTRDKSGAIAAVIAIHAALLFAVLHRWGDVIADVPSAAMKVFDVREVPPPEPEPPPPPPPRQQQQSKPKLEEGGAAPANIRSRATTVVAPTPRIALPTPVPATETPRQGSDPTQGAADVRGPGTGAGGIGTGTGSGSGGNGPGGGGGGVAEPPHLVTPVLTGRDLPRDLLERWPRGATVFMRLRVDARGYVSECSVDRGTGVSTIDSTLCNIVHDRLRFRPALNRSGQAVAGWFGYAQRAPR